MQKRGKKIPFSSFFCINNLEKWEKVCNFALGFGTKRFSRPCGLIGNQVKVLNSPAAVTSVIAPSKTTTVLSSWALREGDGKLEEVRRPANIIRKSITALVG